MKPMRLSLSAGVIASAFALVALAAEPADLVIHNAKVITLDEKSRVAEAVAVRGGRIVVVGGNAEVLALAGPKTEKIDAEGRTVLPGLIDSHAHPISAALSEV